ncbi:MAG: helix-turn-helix domain-containing protein [Prevotella sp.]|jgi:transcriptional regulator with XRE-family HTH domain|nr:helix-turn-helix domain-containing protein [Prevotella sp.]
MDKKNYREVLGERLRAFREDRGISAYRVAQKGNIRIDQINAVESGEKNYTIDAFLGYIAGSDLYMYFAEKDNTNDTHDFNELIEKGFNKNPE